MRFAPGNGLRPPNIEQRPGERDVVIIFRQIRAVGHAFETFEAGASDKVHEHRLDLIVRGVAHSNRLRVMKMRLVKKKAITKVAGSRLYREPLLGSMLTDVAGLPYERNAEPGGDRLNSSGITVRFRPQAVIEVCGNDLIAGVDAAA